MIDTIIFDIGGVLVDDGGKRINVNAHYGLPYNDKDWNKEGDKIWHDYKTGKCTELEYWQRILSGTHMQGKEEEVALYARQVHASSKPGKANFLLPKLKPNYNLAILSDHSTEWSAEVIKTLELDKYCNPIIISSEVGLAKPDRAIYELILKRLNRFDTPDCCIFIDDKLANIIAAEQVGIKGVNLTKEDTPESLELKLKNFGVMW